MLFLCVCGPDYTVGGGTPFSCVANFFAVCQNPALAASSSGATLKRTGRPMHPLWDHFHRGEKRNRYHYHAYCSYCVNRQGMEHVPPTRGVSSDMLRHLESCANCPRNVVESVKELCSRRERNAHAKKQAHTIGNGGNQLEAAVDEEDEDQVLLLDAVAASTAAGVASASVLTVTTTPDDAAATIVAAAGTETDTRMAKRTASEALTDTVEEMTQLNRVASSNEGGKRTLDNGEQSAAPSVGDGGAGFVAMAAKRGRTDSGSALEHTGNEDPVVKWKMSVLQTAVASGIPLSAFRKSEFQELLRMLSPVRLDSDAAISSVGTQCFLEETAAKLARSQLDHVKEGMLNSTIKSGLTLLSSSSMLWLRERESERVRALKVASDKSVGMPADPAP